MVARFERRHAGADLEHDARAFMAEDRREQAFRVGARQRVVIGVADAARLDLHQHLAGTRPIELDLFDRQGLSGFPGDGGTCFHRGIFIQAPAITLHEVH